MQTHERAAGLCFGAWLSQRLPLLLEGARATSGVEEEASPSEGLVRESGIPAPGFGSCRRQARRPQPRAGAGPGGSSMRSVAAAVTPQLLLLPLLPGLLLLRLCLRRCHFQFLLLRSRSGSLLPHRWPSPSWSLAGSGSGQERAAD